MTENGTCYIFSPDENESRPAPKRRKTALSTSRGNGYELPFVPLLRGVEGPAEIELRHQTFESLWKPQEAAAENLLLNANVKTAQNVRQCISLAYHNDQRAKIAAGLLVQGPGNGATAGLFDYIAEDLNHGDVNGLCSWNTEELCITLTSGQSPNLKTALKYINSSVADQFDNDDETAVHQSRSNRLLNYDLQILHDQVKNIAAKKVILLFQDSEAFDGGVLSDLIDVLSSWNDRIPFVLLFGIATSIDLFQSKLSRTAIRSIEGTQVEVEQVDIEDVFKTLHGGDPKVFLGPALSGFLLERQKNFIQNPLALIQAVKYAYMTHFFSNPLVVWLDVGPAMNLSETGNLEAARHLPSFRSLVQTFVDAQEYELARELLTDDQALMNNILTAVNGTHDLIRLLIPAVTLLSYIQDTIFKWTSRPRRTWSEIYILAISNELAGSALLEDTITSLKRLKSNALKDLLNAYPDECHNHLDLQPITAEFANVEKPESETLRSGYDIQHSNLRTTVVAQRVELSRKAAELTPEEAAYTKIIDGLVATFTQFFDDRLINPQELFLHEIFIYDAKSLHREVFMPRPRFAIERALSSPHDYLGCDCCDGSAGGLSASQPATAIVYQLYLESGSVINTADLWSAFWTIFEPEESDEVDKEREKALALFSRALAELKYLGMIKNSRKKADHLAKLSWKGL